MLRFLAIGLKALADLEAVLTGLHRVEDDQVQQSLEGGIVLRLTVATVWPAAVEAVLTARGAPIAENQPTAAQLANMEDGGHG